MEVIHVEYEVRRAEGCMLLLKAPEEGMFGAGA